MNKQNEVMIPDVLPRIIAESGVEPNTALQIKEAFLTMFADADQWAIAARKIVVTDVSQVQEMRLARNARLALKGIRVKAEAARKTLKADALAKGKAIDGIANVLKALIVPLENHLQAQEDFAKRIEAEHLLALHNERSAILAEYEDVAAPWVGDLGAMSDVQFDAIVQGYTARRAAMMQAAADAARKAKEEEVERQKAEKQRQAEVAEARAIAEAERDARLEVERKAKAEREIADAQRIAREVEVYKEREAVRIKAAAEVAAANKAREAVESEREAERAEARRVADAEDERIRQAAAAPDKAKLAEMAGHIRGLTVPALYNTDAEELIVAQVEKFAQWVEGLIKA